MHCTHSFHFFSAHAFVMSFVMWFRLNTMYEIVYSLTRAHTRIHTIIKCINACFTTEVFVFFCVATSHIVHSQTHRWILKLKVKRINKNENDSNKRVHFAELQSKSNYKCDRMWMSCVPTQHTYVVLVCQALISQHTDTLAYLTRRNNYKSTICQRRHFNRFTHGLSSTYTQ